MFDVHGSVNKHDYVKIDHPPSSCFGDANFLTNF
jgi:hypothetical protein